jgi:hypothetical protein
MLQAQPEAGGGAGGGPGVGKEGSAVLNLLALLEALKEREPGGGESRSGGGGGESCPLPLNPLYPLPSMPLAAPGC